MSGFNLPLPYTYMYIYIYIYMYTCQNLNVSICYTCIYYRYVGGPSRFQTSLPCLSTRYSSVDSGNLFSEPCCNIIRKHVKPSKQETSINPKQGPKGVRRQLRFFFFLLFFLHIIGIVKMYNLA